MQKAWESLLSAMLQKGYELNSFTNREIMILGTWGVFGVKLVSSMVTGKVQILDAQETFCLAITAQSASNPKRKKMGALYGNSKLHIAPLDRPGTQFLIMILYAWSKAMVLRLMTKLFGFKVLNS